MKYKTAIFIFLFLCVLFSCQKNKTQYKQYECKADLQIDIFPDSSFFSDIRCMQYHQGQIYLLDVQRRDIVILNEMFNDMHIAGSPGLGPEELANPVNFYVLQDSLYVMDYGSIAGIKNFIKYQFSESYRYEVSTDKRFFCTSGYFYISCVTDSSIFAKVNKNDPSIREYGGKITKFDIPAETYLRNARRSMLSNDCNAFYAISDNLQAVEKYDLNTLELISIFDLSEIPLVKRNRSYIASKVETPKSFHTPFVDSYLTDSSLYLLCSIYGDQFMSNQIIKINLNSEMTFVAIYTLPGLYYESFCVSSDYIFAFDRGSNILDRIKLSDYE